MSILFAFAHLDDESFGPLGTIVKLRNNGHDVTVLSLCKGDRPGNEHVAYDRQEAFTSIMEEHRITPIVYDFSDLHLEYHGTLAAIEQVIKERQPRTVYTHGIHDVHKDHRLVAEACLAACRPAPTSCVDVLYASEVIAASDWSFGQFGNFTPTVYEDITEYIKVKEKALSRYSTELRKSPDARSVESMLATAAFRGKQSGFHYAEAFQLVFARRHRID